MLQAHIAEARNADVLDMLLIPANVELMVLPLTAWEKRVWREAQGRLPAEDRAWYMDVFVNERLRYAINMVASSERHVLPKATPLHRSQRSPSSEGRGGRYSRGGSSGRNVRVMTITESRSADRKKVRFPPQKAWDPEAKWTQECVMFGVCGEKHPPGKCDAFKKLSPKQKLKEINTRELCRLCYRHLLGRDCWSKDKVPNCGVLHLLHSALVMVVQGIGAGLSVPGGHPRGGCGRSGTPAQSQAKGFEEKLARTAGDVEMLVGMDNQGWMPRHVESSQDEDDNLRLMQSMLSPRCILMGSAREVTLRGVSLTNLEDSGGQVGRGRSRGL